MDTRNRKATFVLPSWILEEMADCVKKGVAHSLSSIVREALEQRLRALREEMLTTEFQAAASDPEFISDVEDTMNAFDYADSETARMIRH